MFYLRDLLVNCGVPCLAAGKLALTHEALFYQRGFHLMRLWNGSEVVATGNASCSDMVFGVFAILNYRFAPRFADLPRHAEPAYSGPHARRNHAPSAKTIPRTGR